MSLPNLPPDLREEQHLNYYVKKPAFAGFSVYTLPFVGIASSPGALHPLSGSDAGAVIDLNTPSHQ